MHLDDNAIVAYVRGRLSDHEATGMRAHLDVCPDCIALVGVALKQRSLESGPTELALGSVPHGTEPARVLAAGTEIGPYIIERLRGAGAMGMVYAAKDPRLDRTVALKLIRPELGSRDGDLAERLRRESKALAKLSHPNVTVIYELGAVEETIYVAMEYVAGTTLRQWLETKHSIAEISATFLAAGRGLAAAHAAGLVHRDFKPDNVLLGSDGSVKVSDFGLARAIGDAPEQPTRATRGSDRDLTHTGMIVGTPAYMPPEQLDNGVVDERSDQFAFCIVLYEALYGVRPFRGQTIDELRAAIRAGKFDAPHTIPLHLRRAVTRGLALDPAARFPSMAALLAAISPRRRWAAPVVAGVAVAAIAATTATLLASTPNASACDRDELASVWNFPRATAVQHAFLATGAPRAAETWASISRDVDAFAKRWSIGHRDACEATHVRHEQSASVLDLRTACLVHSRGELDAALGALSTIDRETLGHAHDVIAQLADPSACADVNSLMREAPPPTDPTARKHYDTLRTRLDTVHAQVEMTRYKDAAPELKALVADATFPALQAEAMWIQAKVSTGLGNYGASEQMLFKALGLAQSARADGMVATLATDLAAVTGISAKHFADGYRWADFAEKAIAGKGGDDRLTVRLDSIRAQILSDDGKLAEAEAVDRAALKAARRLTLNGPLLAEVMDSLGSNLAMQGKFDEAIPLLRKALEIRESEYGAVNLLTASTRMNLGNALSASHHGEEAIGVLQTTLDAQEQLFGKDGSLVATTLSNFGQVLQENGKPHEARALLERALAIRIKREGPASVPVARSLANLGYVQIDERDFTGAIATFERADAIAVKALGKANPIHADTLSGIGSAYLAAHKPTNAIAPLEEAVKVYRAAEADPVNIAGTEATLAQALFTSQRDRKRARELVARARPVLVEAGEDKSVAEIDAWLTAASSTP